MDMLVMLHHKLNKLIHYNLRIKV